MTASGSASGPAESLVPPDDGSPETARRYALKGQRLGPEMLEELHQTERVRTSCTFCDETFDGPFRDGRAWFEEHRRTVHSDVVAGRAAATF